MLLNQILFKESFDLEKDNGIFYAERVLYYAENNLRGCAVTILLRQRLLNSIAAYDALTPYYDHAKPVLLGEHHKVQIYLFLS